MMRVCCAFVVEPGGGGWMPEGPGTWGGVAAWVGMEGDAVLEQLTFLLIVGFVRIQTSNRSW